MKTSEATRVETGGKEKTMGTSFKERVSDLRKDESIKRKRWNDVDDIYLIENFHEGYGVSYIALGLKRTETAVMQRIRTLKLYPQKQKRKR